MVTGKWVKYIVQSKKHVSFFPIKNDIISGDIISTARMFPLN